MTVIDRLETLKRSGVIAGFEAPHPNRGLAGGTLPWVVMPADEGPASLYDTDTALEQAVAEMETFGPRHSLDRASLVIGRQN